MSIERDNDAERDARIDAILKRLRDVQQRVEQVAAEAHQKAVENSRARVTPKSSDG